MTTAETYVTAAYLVFLAIVLVYVVLYSFKVALLERKLDELAGENHEQAAQAERSRAA